MKRVARDINHDITHGLRPPRACGSYQAAARKPVARNPRVLVAQPVIGAARVVRFIDRPLLLDAQLVDAVPISFPSDLDRPFGDGGPGGSPVGSTAGWLECYGEQGT